jgi:hypothetical protein
MELHLDIFTSVKSRDLNYELIRHSIRHGLWIGNKGYYISIGIQLHVASNYYTAGADPGGGGGGGGGGWRTGTRKIKQFSRLPPLGAIFLSAPP